jgi:hypothetical protein
VLVTLVTLVWVDEAPAGALVVALEDADPELPAAAVVSVTTLVELPQPATAMRAAPARQSPMSGWRRIELVFALARRAPATM